MSNQGLMFFICGVIIVVAVIVTALAVGWRQAWYEEIENRVLKLETEKDDEYLDDLPLRHGKRIANGE